MHSYTNNILLNSLYKSYSHEDMTVHSSTRHRMDYFDAISTVPRLRVISTIRPSPNTCFQFFFVSMMHTHSFSSALQRNMQRYFLYQWTIFVFSHPTLLPSTIFIHLCGLSTKIKRVGITIVFLGWNVLPDANCGNNLSQNQLVQSTRNRHQMLN